MEKQELLEDLTIYFKNNKWIFYGKILVDGYKIEIKGASRQSLDEAVIAAKAAVIEAVLAFQKPAEK